jgi:hypothetical protein
VGARIKSGHGESVHALSGMTLEITGARRSHSATCSDIGENLTLGSRCKGRLMPHSGGSEFVALTVDCVPEIDNL